MAHLTQSHQRLLESLYDPTGSGRPKCGWTSHTWVRSSASPGRPTPSRCSPSSRRRGGVLRTVRMGDRVVGEFAADRHITRAGMFAVLEDQQR